MRSDIPHVLVIGVICVVALSAIGTATAGFDRFDAGTPNARAIDQFGGVGVSAAVSASDFDMRADSAYRIARPTHYFE